MRHDHAANRATPRSVTSGKAWRAHIERLSRLDLQRETTYFNRPEGGCVHVTFPLPTKELAIA
jgi:hypothetical protein